MEQVFIMGVLDVADRFTVRRPYRGDRPETGQPASLAVPRAVYASVQIVRTGGMSKQEQEDGKGRYHSEALIRPQVTDSTTVS